MRSPGGIDRFGQRTLPVIVRQRHRRTIDRRTVVVTQPLSPVDRGAVIEDARLAVGNLGHLVDAEETAGRFDRRYSGAPQAGDDKTQDDEPKEGHQPLPQKQHRGRQQREQHLKRQLQGRRQLQMGDPPDQCQDHARQQPRPKFGRRLADAAGENSGHAQHRQRDQDRVFVIAVEYLRRQQARKRAADHPAERGAKIKLRQPPRARPASIEFAVAHQRQERERDEIEGNHRQPEHLVPADQAHRERRHCERDKPDHIGMGDPRSFAKRGDEGQQIYRQRKHPQERRGSDIGRQIRRDCDNEAGRHRRKRNPAHSFNRHSRELRLAARPALRPVLRPR